MNPLSDLRRGDARPSLLQVLGAVAYRSGVYEAARLGYERSGVRSARLAVRGVRTRRAARALRRRGGWVRNPHGVRLFVDPADRRAQELSLARGAMDEALLRLWDELVAACAPDVVVDVGANYGEVVLSCAYAAGCEVLALEPNPHVAAFLSRSIAASGGAVRVVEAAASDAEGSAVLHVSRASSGTSSLEATADARDVEVPATRVDTLLGARPGASVLVKIDVEGHERKVLAGLRRTVGEAGRFAAVCEFAHLDDADIAWLHDEFAVWLVNRYTLEPVRATPAAVAALVRRGRTDPYLKDVVLVPVGGGFPIARRADAAA